MGMKWTDERRIKFIKTMKRKRNEKRRNKKQNDTTITTATANSTEILHGDEKQNFDVPTAYAFGKVQNWLESFAQSFDLPTTVVTRRVGELLLRAPRGFVLGSLDRLPGLQRSTTKGNKG